LENLFGRGIDDGLEVVDLALNGDFGVVNPPSDPSEPPPEEPPEDPNEPPAVCTLSNPVWINQQGTEISSATDGQNVFMFVEAQDCEGRSVNFVVNEDDFIGDDFIGNFGPEIVSGNAVSSAFSADYINDASGGPEYYFRAVVSGGVNSGNSANLAVPEESSGTPPPEEPPEDPNEPPPEEPPEQDLCGIPFSLEVCDNQIGCEGIGGYWWSDSCHDQQIDRHIADGVESFRLISFERCEGRDNPMQDMAVANQNNQEFIDVFNGIDINDPWPSHIVLVVPQQCQ